MQNGRHLQKISDVRLCLLQTRASPIEKLLHNPTHKYCINNFNKVTVIPEFHMTLKND